MENKNYYLIENLGELDIRSIFMMGVSNKREDETKIGMYGSGWKYTLAVLLRDGYDIRIFSSLDEYAITTKKETIEGVEYDHILVNGNNTSLTTSMGPKWKPWQAMREILSNGIDAELTDRKVTDIVTPLEGHTRVYVEYKDAVEQFVVDGDDYFAFNKRILFEHDKGKIYMKHSNRYCLYRKGIRCNETKVNSAFDYDFDKIDIDEDRLSHSSWDQSILIWKLLAKLDNRILISKLMDSLDSSSFEWDKVDNLSWVNLHFNEAWLDYLKDYTLIPAKFETLSEHLAQDKVFNVPDVFYDLICKQWPQLSFITGGEINGNLFNILEINDEQINSVLDLRAKLKNKGYHSNYDMKLVKFHKVTLMAAVYHNEILLSEAFFNLTEEMKIKIYFEEIMHLDSGQSDFTRSFQNVLIDQWYKFAFERSSNG